MKSIFKNTLILLALSSVVTVNSCKKEGTGGKSSISGKVLHHSTAIPNAVIYIKYGATEFPGNDVSVYDNSVTADASANYEFKNLQKGSYYLYGTGYDSKIFDDVKGGVGVTIKRNESKTLDLPVTED